MCNLTLTPWVSALSHTSPTLITHARSNAAVKTGAWWTGKGRERQTQTVVGHIAGYGDGGGRGMAKHSHWFHYGHVELSSTPYNVAFYFT